MDDDKDCSMKIFHNEPDYTPNNFDIYFDTNTVPSNIELESAYNLEKRLNKLMPASKKVHLNMGVENLQQNNSVHISSMLRMNNQEVKFL